MKTGYNRSNKAVEIWSPLLITDIGDKMWLAVWDDASLDATGLFARSQKLAGSIEQVKLC